MVQLRAGLAAARVPVGSSSRRGMQRVVGLTSLLVMVVVSSLGRSASCCNEQWAPGQRIVVQDMRCGLPRGRGVSLGRWRT